MKLLSTLIAAVFAVASFSAVAADAAAPAAAPAAAAASSLLFVGASASCIGTVTSSYMRLRASNPPGRFSILDIARSFCLIRFAIWDGSDAACRPRRRVSGSDKSWRRDGLESRRVRIWGFDSSKEEIMLGFDSRFCIIGLDITEERRAGSCSNCCCMRSS